jgi:hypothetical protein
VAAAHALHAGVHAGHLSRRRCTRKQDAALAWTLYNKHSQPASPRPEPHASAHARKRTRRPPTPPAHLVRGHLAHEAIWSARASAGRGGGWRCSSWGSWRSPGLQVGRPPACGAVGRAVPAAPSLTAAGRRWRARERGAAAGLAGGVVPAGEPPAGLAAGLARGAVGPGGGGRGARAAAPAAHEPALRRTAQPSLTATPPACRAAAPRQQQRRRGRQAAMVGGRPAARAGALCGKGDLAHQQPCLPSAAPARRCRIETLSWTPRAFLFHAFLSEAECDHLIGLATPQGRGRRGPRAAGGGRPGVSLPPPPIPCLPFPPSSATGGLHGPPPWAAAAGSSQVQQQQRQRRRPTPPCRGPEAPRWYKLAQPSRLHLSTPCPRPPPHPLPTPSCCSSRAPWWWARGALRRWTR